MNPQAQESKTEPADPKDYVLVEETDNCHRPSGQNAPIIYESQSQQMTDRGAANPSQCEQPENAEVNSTDTPFLPDNLDDDWEWDKSPSSDTEEYLQCCCCFESTYLSDPNFQLFCGQCLCLPCHYGCDVAGLGACCEAGMCCETCFHGCLHCCCAAVSAA